MKRFFSLLCCVLIFFGISGNCYTEELPESILFRDIPWLETEKNVKDTIESIEGIKPSEDFPLFEETPIDSWHREYWYLLAEPKVMSGGVELNYENVPVAGYTAKVSLSFIYPIINGEVSYSTEQSLFYKASYELDDLDEINLAFKDLKKKLTKLYGPPEDPSNPEYQSNNDSLDKNDNLESFLWTEEDGSLVWLAVYYNGKDKKNGKIYIVYAAPDIDLMLTELDTQIKQETNETENDEENSFENNTEGL